MGGEGHGPLDYGREGQDALQMTTAIHLRAQLIGAAYEAVRKIPHESLRTSTDKVKPTTKGMKLLLQTLRDQIAQEAHKYHAFHAKWRGAPGD